MTVTVEIAAPADDEAIRGLVRRQPMPGRVTLAFEREPRFATGCEVTGDHPTVLVARDQASRIVGVACRSVRNAHVNGCPVRLGYLGQLRVDQRFRGRWLVSRGFALLAEIDRTDPVPAYLASIVDGNDEATGVLVGRRRPSFPEFCCVARCHTLAISLRRVPRTGAAAFAAPCRPDELPAVADFLRVEGARRQLSPVWTIEGIRRLAPFGLHTHDIRVARRGRRIAGVIALWDQTSYKQSVVRAYSGWLRPASWFGGLIVPRVGAHVRSAYAAMIAVEGDDRDVFDGLLREMCATASSRAFDYLIVGLDERDPLLPVARAYSHVSYPSRLYLASWPIGVPLHAQLDERPTYVEVATL